MGLFDLLDAGDEEKAIKFINDHPDSVNVKRGGGTPLHLAAKKGYLSVVEKLLEHNAKVNVGNKKGQTPLWIASSIKHQEIHDMLVGKHALLNPVVDDDDDAPYPEYLECMHNHVAKKGLKGFFGSDESLRPYAIQAETLVKALGAHGKEWAVELGLLTLYDLAILIDDSASMKTEEKGTRMATLKRFMEAIAHICTFAHDSEKGKIQRVRFLNSNEGGDHLDKAQMEALLSKHRYSGMTRIGTELKGKILDDLVNKNMKRPLLVMIITDGEIQGENKSVLPKTIENCINHTKSLPGGNFSVAFQFSRVGNDKGAKDMLERLDNHEDFGDHIDCQPAEISLESITAGLSNEGFNQITKLLIGAISEAWDNLED